MANTRSSAKRARQNTVRRDRNQSVRSATHTALKAAVQAIKSQDLNQAKDAYKSAIRALSKAASKGAIPKGRASRKIGRLTALIKKSLPQALSTGKN